MCGIAGIHRRGEKQVRLLNNLVDNLLHEIEYRGRHATGLASLTLNGTLHVERAVVPASTFVSRRTKVSPSSKTVLLHTRFATVGAKEDPKNAHPQTSGTCTAVHNGTILNARAVFDTFQLERKATVDSEVIPAIVCHAGWDSAADALGLLTGGAATAIIDTANPEEVILARLRSYPLEILVTKDVVVWASTLTAISMAWKKTYGKAPAGQWLCLDDYSLVRINGRVGNPEPIDRAPEPPTRKPQITAKKARKAARKAARVGTSGTSYAPYAWKCDETLFTPYERAAIDDLMGAGYSRSTAETLVLDWEEPDEQRDW